MSGDVVELPNLKDEFALNDFASALKRFYVVEDVNRAAEGFSATWYPHLYRVKLKPIVDSQEFKDILDRPENTDNYAGDFDSTVTYYAGQVVKYKGDLYQVKSTVVGGTSVSPPDTTYWETYTENTLRDLMSTYEKEMQINAGVLSEAEADAPLSGFETSHFYTLAVDPTTGRAAVNTVDITTQNIADVDALVSDTAAIPVRDGYQGYLLGDGIPPNGPLSGTSAQFGFGIQFPIGPVVGDTFLRTDYLPNRMFRFDGTRWVKQEDNVRMTLSNSDTRQTLRSSFVNNTEISGINKIATDTVTVDLIGGNTFESGVTTTFTVGVDSVYIVTNVAYDATYKVDAWLNEDSHITSITTANASGFLAFTISRAVQDGSRIRYSVYDEVVQQRQSISKALRFKPQADN